jgi:hypothetical protein
VFILLIFLATIVFIYFKFVSVSAPPVINPSVTEGSFIYPESELEAIGEWENGTYVKFHTVHINITDYYQRVFNEMGWTQIKDNDIKTGCMGDWGGVYTKGKQKVKIHICGPDDMVGASKNLTFYFYKDMDPSEFFGDDYSQRIYNCEAHGVISPISACFTDDTLNVSFSTPDPRTKKFKVALADHENFYTHQTINSNPDNNGVVTFDTSLDNFSIGVNDEPSYIDITPRTPLGSQCANQKISVDLIRCQ